MNLRRSLKINSVDLKITRISKQSIFYTTNVLIFSNMIVQWFFRPFRKHLRRERQNVANIHQDKNVPGMSVFNN